MHLHLMRTLFVPAESLMRTTLDIDDDVLEAARELARQTDRTAGAVISDLARQALTTPVSARRGKKAGKGVGGFVPFKSRGALVTNDLINRLREGDAY
jgi:Arc/MetJ family transcription regulator